MVKAEHKARCSQGWGGTGTAGSAWLPRASRQDGTSVVKSVLGKKLSGDAKFKESEKSPEGIRSASAAQSQIGEQHYSAFG